MQEEFKVNFEQTLIEENKTITKVNACKEGVKPARKSKSKAKNGDQKLNTDITPRSKNKHALKRKDTKRVVREQALKSKKELIKLMDDLKNANSDEKERFKSILTKL